MSKIAIIADLHFGMRNDSEVFDNHIHRFFEEKFFPQLEKEGITMIFIAGDIFDRRKFINFRILNNFRTKFVQEIVDRGIKVYGVPGNHDIFYRESLRVNALEEILGENDNFTIFYEPTQLEYGGVKFSFLPWICDENREQCYDFIQKDDGDILIAHLELSGFKPYRNSPRFEHGMDPNIFSKYGEVYTGHFHHKSSYENVHYLGAVCEMIASDAGDYRGFHIFDTETMEMRFIQNPFTIFSSVNYDDKDRNLRRIMEDLEPLSQFANTYCRINVVNKTNPFYFDKFLDKLKMVGLHDFNVVENPTILTEEASEVSVKETSELLNDYVQELDTSLDKTKLSNMLMNAYLTATQMDHTIW